MSIQFNLPNEKIFRYYSVWPDLYLRLCDLSQKRYVNVNQQLRRHRSVSRLPNFKAHVFLHGRYHLPLEKRVSLRMNKLVFSMSQGVFCVRFTWNCFCGSGEEDVDVKKLLRCHDNKRQTTNMIRKAHI